MTRTDVRITVALPAGDVDVSATLETPDEPWAVLALAHGAGAGMQHPFLVGFAAALRAHGVATMRFAFPYAEAGRRMPGPAAHAVSTWAAVADHLRGAVDAPLFAAGKSYGGRMASVAAAEGAIDPAGLVYLGYPLHPPGRPDAPRVAHLPAIGQPQLFLSGEADPFAAPPEQVIDAVATCRDATLVWVPGGHSFEVKGRKQPAAEVGAGVAPRVVEWMRGVAQRPAA
ncbi:alpha/beta family hydrolase [Microbacterium terricola]|uniref:Alpha/beta hydrolase n=1 Tax=Microbacterium terricola TaxID=344163 RepID=A0ABM8DZG8_9MICO|nr:alpha/beta family hydrolase [Microbacterium terricola]UYK41225.1 dienelactone hydrolase [Microbacterium terricola]BDV30999.1 alpha/beta hydrolase [Microbacterium terricola]